MSVSGNPATLGRFKPERRKWSTKIKIVFIVQLTHRCYFGTETGLDMSSWTTLICNSNIPSNFYSYYYHYVILFIFSFTELWTFLIYSRQILKQTTTRLPQKCTCMHVS